MSEYLGDVRNKKILLHLKEALCLDRLIVAS